MKTTGILAELPQQIRQRLPHRFVVVDDRHE